jgi:peptidyl-prolyl cis-trans isomerase C
MRPDGKDRFPSMVRIFGPSLLILVLVLGSTSIARAVDPFVGGHGSRPLAVVGEDTLTTMDLEGELLATLSKAKAKSLPAMNPEGVLKRLIQDRLLEQEGYRTGADQAPAVRNQVKELIRVKSVRALLDSISAPVERVPEGVVDSIVGTAGSLRRYSHILVKDETLARSLRDSVATGVPFGDLARRHSIDGTATAGGDLGYAAQGAYLEDFETVADKLALDQVSDPVHTQFGWHLIKLTGAKADTLKSRAMADAIVRARVDQLRTARVNHYVDSLKTSYGVTVNDSLVAKLDYGSKDPEIEKQLQTNESVVAVLPTGKFTVKGLTKTIRFTYFHGLGGRDDAAAIRDRMLADWVNEALLSYQARKLGFDRHPRLQAEAKLEERVQVREQVLDNILQFKFAPTDDEIRGYYQEHIKDFVPDPRIKVVSVLAKNAETAKRFRGEMDRGAGLKWLAEQTPVEVDSIPPFPEEWIKPVDVGLKGQSIAKGTPIGPLERPGGWALAEVTAIEEPRPWDLAECKDKVRQAMKNARTRQAIQDALSQLQAATKIQIEPSANEIVAEVIKQYQSSPAEGGDR